MRIVILSDICSLTVSIRHLNHVWPEFAISYTSILQKSTRSLRKSRCRSQNLTALRERPLPRWSARFRILKKEGILDTSRKQIEILDEEKLFLFKKDNNFVINGDSEAIKDLEIFKDMNFEEIDLYVFYVKYLSKKEYENKKVLVGYNGIDGKEVTMSKFKEDINEIRDSRSTFKN